MRKVFQIIWSEFVYGSHLLSLAISSIFLFSVLLFNYEVNWIYLLIPYSMVQIVYKFNYIIEKEDYSSNPERAKHIIQRRRQFIVLIFFFSILLLSILIYYKDILALIFCILHVIGGLLYPKHFTKRIVAFKNIYTSFFISLIGFLPAILYNITVNFAVIYLVAYIFLCLFKNTIFFDFKDVETDKFQGYKTIPAVLGIKKAMLFLHLVNIFSFIILLIAVLIKIFPSSACILFIFFFYNLYYIQTANKSTAKAIRFISYVLVDGEYILWPLLIWLDIKFI